MDLEQIEQRIAKYEKQIAEHETKIEVLRSQFSAHADYTKIAVDKSEGLMNARMEGMNGVREQLTTQASTFMPRSEYGINHKLLEGKIDSVAKMLYIGIGMLLIVQVAVQVAIHFLP